MKISNVVGFLKSKLQEAKLSRDERGLMDIVYIAVYLGIAVVAGAITIYITQTVLTTTGTPTNAKLNNSSSNLISTMETGYSFLPIVAVAAIGAVAIGYVFNLIPGIGRRGGGMV